MSVVKFYKVNTLPPQEEIEPNAFYYLPDGPTRTKGYLTDNEGNPREIGKKSELIGDGVNGGIFISNIEPQDDGNVHTKIWKDDYNDGRKQLISCQTTTTNVKITLTAVVGNTNYKPYIYKGLPGTPEGEPIDYEEILDPRDLNVPEFVGTIDVDLTDDDAVEENEGGYYIRYNHEDGAACEVFIATAEAPVIQSAEFNGDNSYPELDWADARQLHLANGDTTQLHITTDVPVSKVHFLDSHSDFEGGSTDNIAFDNKDINVPSSPSDDFIVSTSVKNHNYNDIRECYAIIKVEDENGTLSEPFFTGTGIGDGEDKKEFVKLDNTTPTTSINIEYPTFTLEGNSVNQLAIKEGDTATLSFNAGSTGTHETVYEHEAYNNIEFDGDIPNTTESASVKWITTENGFDLTTNNYRFTLKRGENGKVVNTHECVKVADTVSEIGAININSENSDNYDGTILRSGPNDGAEFWCSFNINQPILASESGGSPLGDAWEIEAGTPISGININTNTTDASNSGLNNAIISIGTSADPSIFVQDSVTKDLDSDTFKITVYNYAGKSTVVEANENQIKSIGFIERIMENVNLHENVDLQVEVINGENMNVAWQRMSDDPIEDGFVQLFYVSDPNNGWGFDGDLGSGEWDAELNQFSLYNNIELFIDDTAQADLEGGDEGNIRLKVEEEI